MTANSEIRVPHRDLPTYWPPGIFPAYRYVPGLHPHPTRDPAGHSFRPADEASLHAWDVADWQRLEPWLHGVDLFNRFYFWEAHESWEVLWRSARRGDAPALMLQGLIQVSAALLKCHVGAAAAAARLSVAALEKLNLGARDHRTLMGLDIARTLNDLQIYFRLLAVDVLPILDEHVPILRLSTGQTPGK